MNKYLIDSFSKAGKVVDNEDSIGYKAIDNDCIVLAIADGIGGEDGGEIASKIAVNTVINQIECNNYSLKSIFNNVQFNINEYIKVNRSMAKMGTTLTVALIKGDRVKVGHVGDARIYHLRGNKIAFRTKDQTEVQKLIDLGVLSESRAKRYHRRNVLLSAITSSSDFDLQENEFSLESKDRIILMTDGTYNLVESDEIIEVSNNNQSISDFTKRIESIVESREIKDDYSMIALQVN